MMARTQFSRTCVTWRGLALAALLFLGGCNGPDTQMARLCAEIVPAFEPSSVKLRLSPAQQNGRNSVRVPFTAIDPDGAERPRFVACAFSGTLTQGQEQPDLVAVESDEGQLNEAQLFSSVDFLSIHKKIRPKAARGSSSAPATGYQGVLPI